MEQCKSVNKILNNQQPCNINILFYNEIHTYLTRSLNNIHQVYARTNIGLNNTILDASKKFNNLPDFVILTQEKKNKKYLQLLSSFIF